MKVTRVGGRISRDRLPPGGQANHGWLAPRGATCPGGKINWDTGLAPTKNLRGQNTPWYSVSSENVPIHIAPDKKG